ncbi:hypothetical protein [Hymenobacter terrenus]|uniref:hypothetical protein n=1 Tax=Hymenobacter terrenus TaxID=1629124 RepID=UPI000697ABDC|nr:hypothetical protein [Hymenobacter terrenus]
MKHFFFTILLALFAGFSLVLSSCSDDKKADPTPTTGTVNGQITPANSVTTVTATSTATPTTTATATPTASGTYTFTNMAAGTYTLSFTPATGFTAPATQTVAVTAGGTATATPVTVTMGSTGGTATFTYTINGTATTANLASANVLSGSLFIQSSSGTGSRIVTLSLDVLPTGPRSYTFGGASSTSEINVIEAAGSNLVEWSTSATGGTGTVTITSVTTNPRRVSGTFSAVAQPDGSGATGTRTITAGTFSNLEF